jgi:hypothetical protein
MAHRGAGVSQLPPEHLLLLRLAFRLRASGLWNPL